MANTENMTIWDDEGVLPVDVITDVDGTNRLATDSKVFLTPISKETSSISEKLDIFISGESNETFVKLATFTEGSVSNAGALKVFGVASEKVMQIFRASVNNIHKVKPIFKNDSGNDTQIDSFDSIVGNWISSDTTNTPISQETTIKVEGTGSMKVSLTDGSSKDDEISYTFGSSQDYSAVDTFNLKFYTTHKDNKFKLVLSDGTNNLESGEFSTSTLNNWVSISLDILNFTEQGGGTTDKSAITSIYFLVTKSKTATVYFDDLRTLDAVVSETVTLKVYDFGSTSNPTNLTDGTLLNLDDGGSSSSIIVDNSIYHAIEFSHQIGQKSGTDLIVGNYYGLVFEGKNVTMAGDTTQKYQSGDFYTLDGSDNTTAQTASAVFGIYSVPNTYTITRITIYVDDKPLTSELYCVVNDTNKSIHGSLINDFKMFDEQMSIVSFDGNTIELNKEDEIYIYILHDVNSKSTQFRLHFEFKFDQITRYG